MEPNKIVAFLLLLLPARAVAQARHPSGPICDDPRVTVEDKLQTRWLEPVVRLCEGLGSIPDLDDSARLRIASAGNDVILEASLGDGRIALRRVQSPDDLRATVEALLVLPPVPRETPRGEPEKADRAAPPVAPVAHPSDAPHASATTVELGAAVSARVLGVPTYLSAGGSGYAGIRPGPFLLALSVRWEPLEALASGAFPEVETSTVGAGFATARRVLTSDAAKLDAGVTAALVTETQTQQLGNTEQTVSQTDLRVGLVSRALVGGSSWHFAPALEAEVSPARLRRNPRLGPTFPTLPAWSVGVGLGATWDSQ